MKGKYFTKPDANFLPLRKAGDIENFLREFYSEVDVSPKEVEYLEAYGAGNCNTLLRFHLLPVISLIISCKV